MSATSLRNCLSMESIRKILAANLKSLMEERGWSNIELAKALDTFPSNIGRWVNGESWPESKYLDAILKTFSVPPQRLFSVDKNDLESSKWDQKEKKPTLRAALEVVNSELEKLVIKKRRIDR